MIDDLMCIIDLNSIVHIYINRIASQNNTKDIINILSQYLSLSIKTTSLLQTLLSTYTWNRIVDQLKIILASFNILRIECITAKKLSKQEKINFYTKITKINKAKYDRIYISFDVNVDIIGGVIVKMNGKKYDHSYFALKNKIQNILYTQLGVV